MDAYGVDWIYGDGISDIYADKNDAYLEVINYLITDRLEGSSNYTELQEQVDYLSEDITSLLDDDYVDDYVYISWVTFHPPTP